MVIGDVSSWQAFPNTPWIFVYRDPVPVMMSLLGFKGGVVRDRSWSIPYTVAIADT